MNKNLGIENKTPVLKLYPGSNLNKLRSTAPTMNFRISKDQSLAAVADNLMNNYA